MPRGPSQRPPAPGNEPKTTPEILQAVADRLRNAELGLADLRGDDPALRLPGLENIVVWGKAVTPVLHKLRKTVGPSYEEWYAPWKEEMEDDELLKYFYNLRNEVLKEGNTPSLQSSIRSAIITPEILSSLPKPPGATGGFAIGGPSGVSGWIVKLPDGTEAISPFEIPPPSLEVTVHMPGSPTIHKGRRSTTHRPRPLPVSTSTTYAVL